MPDISADLLTANVLIVDDEGADRRLMAAILEGAGYSQVTATGDPASARALHRDNRYDLIILDLMMPGTDGFAVMRELREIEGDGYLPVLAVTSDTDLMARALGEGARDFIGKPLNRIEVLARVRNMLRERMLMNRLRERGRESESHFRALVEQSIVGICMVDQGRFVYVNPRMCEILGYSLGELIGMETMQLVVEADRERLGENRRRGEAGDAAALAATYRLRHKDGRIVHLAVEGKLVTRDGRRVLLGIAQDVTERVHASTMLREAETHYRALIEQSLAGVYIMENERPVYVNPMLCELLGYSLGEITGMDWRGLVVAEDRGIVEHVLARRRAGEAGSIRMQCRARCKEGRVVHLSVESKVLEFGGRPAVIGLVQDITERVQALDKLRHDNAQRKKAQAALEFVNRRLKVLSNRMLDIQEEERRRISRELHDDVGQSLLALKIGLHRLQAPAQAEGAHILEQCIGVAESIHGKVRELSVELRPPHLEQLGLADALRWLANRQSGITGVAIRVRCSGPRALGVAPEIETACYRICQEALNNATRHARARAITVELAAEANHLTLAIRDDGVGFDRNAKRELAAGGMGLITMEERAELAGGRFEITTEPAAGTCVKVVFPLVARAAQASA